MSRTLRSTEGKKKWKKKLLVVAVFFVILSLFVAYGVFFLAARDEVTIVDIEISGAQLVSEKEVYSLISHELTGRRLFFLPNRNSLFYPKARIESRLLSTFPALSAVSIDLLGYNVMSVALSERKSAYLWCQEIFREVRTPNESEQEEAGDSVLARNEIASPQRDVIIPKDPSKKDCIFMDKSGYGFSPAPSFSGSGYVEFYGGDYNASSTSRIGKHYVDENYFFEVTSFLESLERRDQRVGQVFLGEHSYGEVHLRAGWKIKFFTDADLRALVENIETVIKGTSWREEADLTRPLSDLEYLDFRFDPKVYYKMRD